MRLGIFGGTFDPPHLAHLVLADEAHYQLGLDRVLWVLTPDPPHKEGRPLTPLMVRIRLLTAAIAGNPAFELNRVDIDRPGPYYSVDTMRILGEKYPQADLFYLMGGDSLRDLPTWHRPLEFMATCHALGVMRRPGDQLDLNSLQKRLPGILAHTRFIDTPLLEISASLIRQRVAAGLPYRYYLPENVFRIIQDCHLYFPG
jgi:nicotinate-nucleotide adenylyltransferase